MLYVHATKLNAFRVLLHLHLFPLVIFLMTFMINEVEILIVLRNNNLFP
jgi:hypothetical protein